MGKAFQAPRSDVYNLDPDEIVVVDDPEHPLYDERVQLALDDNMVKNIMTFGVIEPVVVTKDGDKAVVVAGRRRVLHAREANKRLTEMGADPLRVKCELRRGDDTDLYGVAISENEHRLDDTPLGRAYKLQRYLNMGGTEDEAAKAFGVSAQSITNWLTLLELSSPVKKAVEQGRIAASAACQLSELPKSEQKDALDILLAEAKPTAKAAKRVAKKQSPEKSEEEIIKIALRRLLKKNAKHIIVQYLDEVEEELAAKAK